MAKSITLCCLVAEVGSLAAFAASKGANIGLPSGHNHDPTCTVISASVAPIKLNGGNA